MKTPSSIALLVLSMSISTLAYAQTGSTGTRSDRNLGNGMSTSTECTVGTAVHGGAHASRNNVRGGGSVGSGASCTNTTGYADSNGYINMQTTCQSGSFASAQGQAGANGLSLCADASAGSDCTSTLAAGGNSQYGGGGGSAGVSGGASEGAGLCGGVTFGKGSVNISMCGNLALDIGVDVCVNGSVNYKNIYTRTEPFASRAVAQAAKCAANATSQSNCVFTTGDMLANAAAPYYGRTKAFFNGKVFRTDAASAVWKDKRAIAYRTNNYAKSVAKFGANNLKNTTYNASGTVVNASNQVVDTGTLVAKNVTGTIKDLGNKVGNQGNQFGNKTINKVNKVTNKETDNGVSTVNKVADKGTGTVNKVADTSKDTTDKAKDGGNKAINGIKNCCK